METTAPGEHPRGAHASEEKRMDPIGQPPVIVAWTRRLEDATALDAPVQAIEFHIQKTFGTGARASALRGDWLGHPKWLSTAPA
ncbi:MAG: hypothetical protein ACR2FV_06805 [Ornithinimicrobium sp.]|uniref:hypothetical protein n=1 Tax=Ornithinimicrobium sp. TaxID=1977084 RepID=UPI003D9B0943